MRWDDVAFLVLGVRWRLPHVLRRPEDPNMRPSVRVFRIARLWRRNRMVSRVAIHALVPLLRLLVDDAVLYRGVVFSRRVRLCQILLVWCGQNGHDATFNVHEENAVLSLRFGGVWFLLDCRHAIRARLHESRHYGHEKNRPKRQSFCRRRLRHRVLLVVLPKDHRVHQPKRVHYDCHRR